VDIFMDVQKTKELLLEELYAPYKKCLACPLGFLGRTTVVFGQGNANAALMLIGEAPGQQEDQQGKPFVGKSGQLLNRIFTILDIDRSDIFISNVVKCRPPGNRKPTLIESMTCKKLLLLNQIAIIKPQVICTLGATALEGLLDRPVKMMQCRGNTLSFNEIMLIPTLHPAYILRNPSQLEKIISDLHKAKELAYQKK